MRPSALNPPAGVQWLTRRARLSPRLPALFWEDRVWTFADLERAVLSAASTMASAARPGQPVAVLAANTPTFVCALHAISHLGSVVIPLNTRLRHEEMVWQLRDAGAVALVHDEPNAPRAQRLANEIPGLRLLALAHPTLGGTRPHPSPRGVGPDLTSAHSIVYTSGTSGRPKGAVLTHGNHLWSALASALRLGLREDDRWLACLPLFHIGGMAILLRSVIYGIPVVLHPSFEAASVCRAIDTQGVTIVSLVPTTLGRLLQQRGDKPWPTHLRCLLVGGGPIPPPLWEECQRRGWPVAPTYGLTEAASQVATLSPAEAAHKPGSAGTPLFFTELLIVDEAGRQRPANRPGEILIRGPTISPGYIHGPTLGAHDWFRTGDLGYLDEDGYLYVLDRRDDLIVTGGENVYPAEVENVLLSHPHVLEAAVFGLPDPEWGQRVAAAVTLRPGATATADELIVFCRAKIAAYKVPKEVRLVACLPRNAAGKPLRRHLRDSWTSGRL